jgi:hypothetical protein
VVFFVSFDRFEVPTHNERGRLLLKFRFRVEFFDFRISAYSELTLEYRLGFSPSSGLKDKSFFFYCFFKRELMGAPDGS